MSDFVFSFIGINNFLACSLSISSLSLFAAGFLQIEELWQKPTAGLVASTTSSLSHGKLESHFVFIYDISYS